MSSDDIRLRGHRIGIENVLDYYLERYTPEDIAKDLLSLSLEQIHATITYYLHNRDRIDSYLLRLAEERERRYQEFRVNPSPLVQHLKTMKVNRQYKNK
ncbi:DUF433 domain-containing protein [Gloeocapsopsis sp. IPPAS B-1203]|uniref:DUF433 domain-containing protein n=1 Tax=Gloeocapsopsis sp. IPPAS B-1203 TaxID=2049454 RepID=UPI0025A30536|nr:DUF433 domain-containing protein [Gloeocapsopsis sp. IPPAS B-1203]